MAIDISEPQSDGWWLHRLAKKLEGNHARFERLDRYFRGDPDLPVGAENAREVYRAFQKKSRLNAAALVAEAPRERMTPAGFRSTTDDTATTDPAAAQVWNDNDLSVECADVHQSMLVMGNAYVIVGPPDETGSPVITSEDPRQVVTIHDPVRQRNVRAAAKFFHDPEEQRDYGYLYLPGRVAVAYRDVKRSPSNPMVRFSAGSWDWDEDKGGELPFQTVPVVRFRNQNEVGEFEPHLDLLDRINHMILQRVVIATFQAFKQRAIKNAPLNDPDTGKEIDYEAIFTADPGAVWQLPGTAEMWESGQVDLTPILSSVKDDLQHLAAVSRTPLTYLTPDAASQSAEGASLMREVLVFKTDDRIERAKSAWLDTMRLAFMYMNDDERSRRGALDMLWAPVERYSLQQRADASSKAGDLPWRTKMLTVWQFTPEQVDKMETERAMDALLMPQVPDDAAI